MKKSYLVIVSGAFNNALIYNNKRAALKAGREFACDLRTKVRVVAFEERRHGDVYKADVAAWGPNGAHTGAKIVRLEVCTRSEYTREMMP